MATKTKKPAARKAKPRSRKRTTPPTIVPNHHFPPGTKVGFFRPASVEMERNIGREPIPSPVETATVAKAGTLAVAGLAAGQWVAAGPIGETWRYYGFSVK